jgi:serine/threonine protein kinase
VKRFKASGFDQTKFVHEIEILANLNHPCALRILGWRPPIGKDPAEIHTALAENGSLSGVLEKVAYGTRFPFWNPTGKGILICGIALGLRFVHSKGIIHSDLKPSNILLTSAGEAVISDFGVSRFESNDYTWTPNDGATLNYAAPELYIEGAVHTRQVDVFALGLVMYEIITERAVFPSSECAIPIMKRIRAGEMPAVPDECGSLMQELIPKCWAMNAEDRPTVDDIIRDFKAAKLRILPGADATRLRAYIAAIEEWEVRDAAQSQSK